jgi:Mrp family chromosome partitioning ATPase
VILVVEQRRTRAPDVRRAKEVLGQVGAKLLGVVLKLDLERMGR